MKLFGEIVVTEDVLGAGLTVVKVAANGPNGYVLAALRCHLAILDVADAVLGVHDADRHAVDIAEAFKCGFARVA